MEQTVRYNTTELHHSRTDQHDRLKAVLTLTSAVLPTGTVVKHDKEGTDNSVGVCDSQKAPLNNVLLKQRIFYFSIYICGHLADAFIQSNLQVGLHLSEERETSSLSGTVRMFIETSAKHCRLLGSPIPRTRQG